MLSFGMPMVALHWEKYNKIYRVQMPKVTPHVCRHTFCSNMDKSGMNPKALQYIMGHSDIGVTLNTYTHVQYEDAEKEMGKIFEFTSIFTSNPHQTMLIYAELYRVMQNVIKKLFICHGNILKCSEKACKINGFAERKGAYYTTTTPLLKEP